MHSPDKMFTSTLRSWVSQTNCAVLAAEQRRSGRRKSARVSKKRAVRIGGREIDVAIDNPLP
jgi:hypothetical protein